MCVALLGVALAHLAYTVVVRPYKKWLEQLLSVINAVIVVGIAVCAVWTRLSSDNDGSGTATLAMGYCLLIANAFYFVQLIVLGVWFTLEECGPRRANRSHSGAAVLTLPEANLSTAQHLLQGGEEEIRSPVDHHVQSDRVMAAVVVNPLIKSETPFLAP